MRALAKMSLAEQWAERICVQHQRSVESVIETGRLLVKAKDELLHGEWGRMFADGLVPFSQGTAERLMAVANHPLLSNSAHAPVLPPSWMTLYELTKVPERTLKNALRDGVITADMPRKAVAALMPEPRPTRRVVEITGDDATDIYDDQVATPEEVRDAFLLRASEAARMATYDGPITPEVVRWAHAAATAWTALERALEER